MKRIYVLFLLLTLISSACSKINLEEEGTLLLGEWKWHYSIRTYDIYFAPPYSHQTITDEKEYLIHFEKRGKVKLYEDGKKIATTRLEDLNFDPVGITNYGIEFDNSSAHQFNFKIGDEVWTGWVGNDSLKIYEKFPYDFNQGSTYTNYFYRIN